MKFLSEETRFISEEKMSKRERSTLNKQKRTMWDFKPTTRIKPSAKIYNRKRLSNDR